MRVYASKLIMKGNIIHLCKPINWFCCTKSTYRPADMNMVLSFPNSLNLFGILELDAHMFMISVPYIFYIVHKKYIKDEVFSHIN